MPVIGRCDVLVAMVLALVEHPGLITGVSYKKRTTYNSCLIIPALKSRILS